MEINEESYLFWTTLESRMKTKLKDYIKNTLSFTGYGTALSFKDLDQEDIRVTENYVKSSLIVALNTALLENKIEYTQNEKMWFFGPFASAPEHFAFPPGELKSIFALAKYVKQIVDQPDECCGLHHFANAAIIAKKGLSYEENMVQSVFGLVFGCLREKKQIQLADSILERREELFKKASHVFEGTEVKNDISSRRQFTLESVDVKFVDQKWKGRVKCIFCNENDLSGDVSVYFKPNGSLVLANLNKHIQKYHTVAIFKNGREKKGYPKTITLKVEPAEAMETEAENVEAMDFNEIDSHPTETQTNSAEDLPLVSIEEVLYGQISAQCIKMTNRTIANTDKTSTKFFSLHPAETRENRSVQYCKMKANGDCFFLSIAHQLFNVKVGSKQHQEQALQLRKSVVAYIEKPENFPNFVHDLKNRLACSAKANDSEIQEMCAEFLNLLSKSGIWAGTESIRAISEMKNANVVVINDDGNAYMPCHFNAQAAHTILLLFGTQNGKSNNNSERSHYDSVITFHKGKISEISSKISEAETHHVQFVKEAENRSIISID